MTKQEKQVLKKIMESTKDPSIPIATYSENFVRTEEPNLVQGISNTDLLSDPRFKAGWARCYDQFQQYLAMLFASKKDQERYAGKAK